MTKMFAAIAIAVSTVAAATTINMHMKDKTVVTTDVSLIDSVSFTTSEVLGGKLFKGPMITDADINANDTILLDASVVYTLSGLVYAEAGSVLNIPAGTVIKAKAGTNDNVSALIITKGAKINVKGTAAKPVIMTAESDDLADATDLDNATARGLWGGLVLCGDAKVNTLSGTSQVEGIAATETRTVYGGMNDADNSGVIQYLSIRYPGTALTKDNEINGLTLAGVGSGTVIENVEVFNCADDGVEFFGGAVNPKNVMVVGADDDGFDWDFGYRGNGDGWVVVQIGTVGDKLLELDGTSKDNRGSALFSMGTITNATFVGKVDATAAAAGGMTIHEETGLIIKNSVFANVKNGGLKVDDNDGGKNYTGTVHFANNQFDMMGNAYNIATPFSHEEDAVNAQPNNLTAIMAKFTPANAFSVADGVTSGNLVPATSTTKGALAGGDWTGWTFWSATYKGK